MKPWLASASGLALLLAWGMEAHGATPTTITDPAGVNQETVNAQGQGNVHGNVTITNTAQTFGAIVDSSGLHIVCDSGCAASGNVTIGNVSLGNSTSTIGSLIANQTVQVTNTPSVTISGTPNVAVTAVPANMTVQVTNTPNVAVTNTPSVTISGTPAVTVSSGNVTTNPQALTTTNASGSVTSGGAFQNALASNAGRKGCLVVNISAETEYAYFGAGTANLTNSIPFAPNFGVSCNIATGVITDELQVMGNTTGDKFVLNSQ